jgi:hypothetical protein
MRLVTILATVSLFALVACSGEISSDKLQLQVKEILEKSTPGSKIAAVSLLKQATGNYSGTYQSLLANGETRDFKIVVNVADNGDITTKSVPTKDTLAKMVKEAMEEKSPELKFSDIDLTEEGAGTFNGTYSATTENQEQATFKITVKLADDGSWTSKVKMTKETLEKEVARSIETTLNNQPLASGMWPPAGLKVAVGDVSIIQKDDANYSGYFDGKVKGVYGLDKHVGIDVIVDQNDGTFNWKITSY